jgi:hypothetical protein
MIDQYFISARTRRLAIAAECHAFEALYGSMRIFGMYSVKISYVSRVVEDMERFLIRIIRVKNRCMNRG